MRQLVVNADDFGASADTNSGILLAHDQGIVTSTSLMVRGPAAGEAVDASRTYPNLGFGLHVDLGEWIYQDAQWKQLYQVVDLTDVSAVRAEVEHQHALFRKILGGDPTHIDSHQHIHREGAAREIVIELAARLKIPVRHFAPAIQYCGLFYGQSGKGYPYPEGITADSLIHAIRQLKPGISELACHPGLDTQLPSMYQLERLDEVKSLCDPRVRQWLVAEHISLCSFKEIQL